MKNKYYTLIMIVVLALSLIVVVGCNNDNSVPEQSTEEKASTDGFSSSLEYGKRADGISITITLSEGVSFKNIESEKEVTSWFTNLPSSVSVKAPKVETKTRGTEEVSINYGVKDGDKSAVFTLSGIINEAPKEAIMIKIPATYNSLNKDINVSFKNSETATVIDSRLTVTFVYDDGSDKKVEVKVENGTMIPNEKRPSEPQMDGAIFKGWFDETDTAFSLDSVITKDMILKAKWEVSTSSLRAPIIKVIKEKDGIQEIVIERNNQYGAIYYSTDGSDPVPDPKKCKTFYNETLKVVKGTMIKALVFLKDEVSSITTYQADKIDGFYALGTESTTPRVMELDSGYNNRYHIKTLEGNDRVTIFTPSKDIRYEVAKDYYAESLSDPFQNNISILGVFERDANDLLVVGSAGFASSNLIYFYYFADRATGEEKGQAIAIIGPNSNLSASRAEVVGNNIYLIGLNSENGEAKICVCIYDLVDKTVVNKFIPVTQYGMNVIEDTFVVGSSLYIVGFENDNPKIWKVDKTSSGINDEIKTLDGYSGAIFKGAGDESGLYLVVSPRDDSVNKKLIKYNFSTGKSSQ